MRGILYSISVGPGDWEDMTLKAVRILRQCPMVAIPKADSKTCVSYQIALKAVPELKEKELVCIDVPMTKDHELSRRRYEEGASQIIGHLKQGKDTALLTLGDATVYASSMYLVREVQKQGYEAEIVSGIPSFCAAAAKLAIALGEREEQIHILPGSYDIEQGLGLPGLKILMKMGRSYKKVRAVLKESGYEACMVENCGMEGEQIYRSLEEMPETAGYYSLIIARNPKS